MPKVKIKSFSLNTLKGFTLIELLVVISIIAILLSVATVSYTNSQQKGRDNRRKSDLKAIQQSLELYFQQNGRYPETISPGLIKCGTETSGEAWGTGSFACNSITYMSPLPRDPINGTSTQYYYNSPTPFNSYTLSANLENTSDPDLPVLGNPCTPQSGYSYCVKNP